MENLGSQKSKTAFYSYKGISYILPGGRQISLGPWSEGERRPAEVQRQP